MNRSEVKELFQIIGSVYPSFIPNDERFLTAKVNTWTNLMKDMDYKRVIAKAEEHARLNKFPPTIAEIAAYAPEKNEHLEKMKQWEKEAADVPQSVKNEFKRTMEQLFKEKGNDL
jgi:hypothetical protein